MEYKTKENLIKLKAVRDKYLRTKSSLVCVEMMPLCKLIFSDLITRTHQAVNFVQELDDLCKEEMGWKFWKDTRLKPERKEIKIDLKMISDSLFPLPEFCKDCMDQLHKRESSNLMQAMSVIVDRLSTVIDISSTILDQLEAVELKINSLLERIPISWLKTPGIARLPIPPKSEENESVTFYVE